MTADNSNETADAPPPVAGTPEGLAAGTEAAIASAAADPPHRPARPRESKRSRKVKDPPADATGSAPTPDDAAEPSTPPPDEPAGPAGPDDQRSRRTTSGDWTWDGEADPCPVRALGYADGMLHFTSAAHEYRVVGEAALTRMGVLAGLFGGDLAWPVRHFWKPIKRTGSGVPVDAEALAVELIGMCSRAGQFDTSIALRGPGVWRLTDGRVLVHCGDALLIDAAAQPPGLRQGGALYRSWAAQQRPAIVRDAAGRPAWDGAPADVGQALVTALGEWRWSRPDTEPELFAGGIAHAMLGDAVTWHSHLFLRAQSGAGKSTLLRLAAAALGAGSHGVFNNITAAYIEQTLSRQARAVLLDEYENDTDETRLRRLTEVIRLMSDGEGGHGGRGSGSGEARDIRLTGTVFMAATLREAARPQDLNRTTLLRALRLYDGPPATDADKAERAAAQDRIEALIEDFKAHSPALRARMLGGLGLYRENVARARATLLGWGCTPRDATQLGHLVAGFWTLTGDEPADDTMREAMRKYLVHLPAADEADDDASIEPDARNLLNALFGAEDHLTWSGGSRQTIGQLVAKARDDAILDGAARDRLLPLGLRLVKGEEAWSWSQAWLAIANRHTGLLRIFENTPYRGGKWAQVLEDWDATSATAKPLRFAGVQSRARLVPAQYLPDPGD